MPDRINRNTFITKKGEPFNLLSGHIVLPQTDPAGNKTVNPEQKQAVDEITAVATDPFANAESQLTRTLADVPLPPKQMNMMMLVVSYSMWGLSTNAIAYLTNITADQVVAAMESEYFTQIQADLLKSIRHAEESSVMGYLAANSVRAAQVIVSQLASSIVDVQRDAAKDVLDRTGFRPIDRSEHINTNRESLRIVMVTEKPLPSITINHEDVE